MEYRAILFLTIVLILPLVYAQENIANGRIYTLTYSPEKVVVLEDLAISIGVENTQSTSQNYKLSLTISKDGQIKYETSSNFDLRGKGGITLSLTYTPDDIGGFDVVVKLYDKYGIELYDTKIMKINVISEIGPFDLELDVPTNTIRPNYRFPVKLTLGNLGDVGTDVEVKISINCFTQQSPYEKFFIFLNPKEFKDKVVSLISCNEPGIHDIYGEVLLFNKTWMSSVSQILINESYIELQFNVPETIELVPGGSKVFDISVKNMGNVELHNLRMIVGKIPVEWVSITPESMKSVKPQETVMFIVNITIPKDAQAQDYTLGISAAAGETLTRKETKLKILGLAAFPEEEKPIITIPPIIPAITSNWLALSIAVAGVGGILLYKFREKLLFRAPYKYHYARGELLNRLRTTIESKQVPTREEILKKKMAILSSKK